MWIITYNHLDQMPCLVHESDPNQPCNLKDYKYSFRLLDGDGELYFSGRSTSDDDEEAFDPLDRTMAVYGCVEIQYLQANGVWETL